MFAALLLATSLVIAAKPAEIARTPARAKLRVVNIWATWCVPCVHEMDDLRAISKAFAGRVEFAGVSMDDVLPGDEKATRAKVSKFLASKKIDYTNYYYSGPQTALVDSFAFSGELPVTIVYDRSGKERFRIQGAIDRKVFSDKLRDLLK
jgi:thiol-disulfide isomerase/thioredoxin